MRKVDCIVYSKNRACQLDLLLRSIKDNFENVGDVYVLCTTSENLHRDSYVKLFKNNYGLNLVKVPETNFKYEHEKILENLETKFFLPVCDDDCFIKRTNVDSIIEEYEKLESSVSAISLKGGLNITHNYPNIPVELPQFIDNPYLLWEWSKSRPDVDWGYPTCINAFIYDKAYYMELLSHVNYSKTPEIEPGFNTIRSKFKPFLMSFHDTRVINTPVNRIQTTTPTNPNGVIYRYDPKYMAKLFLDGYTISTKNIYGLQVGSGNVEIKFEFEKF